jgi:hypothetical protein
MRARSLWPHAARARSKDNAPDPRSRPSGIQMLTPSESTCCVVPDLFHTLLANTKLHHFKFVQKTIIIIETLVLVIVHGIPSLDFICDRIEEIGFHSTSNVARCRISE